MKVLNTHRKCMVCQNETTDLTQEKCSCGAYMYVMGQIYSPKVQVAHGTTDKTKK